MYHPGGAFPLSTSRESPQCVFLPDLVMTKKGWVESMQSLENHCDKVIYLLTESLHRNWLSTNPSGSLTITLTIQTVNVRGIHICRT